ncbi:BgTH12-03562 [Blumeria graminis f. sp. triticale]|uniref:BgTH12-03562 n=1 Tax=Blumeria graminis f. sp. triticale TaxID=1689686 RepID=A0A9W4GD38_BLUGR|nr:BgTH12-03562 [Blumeria graminis f. sp. triticale]
MARLAKISVDAASRNHSPSAVGNQERTSEDDNSAPDQVQPGSLAVRRAVTKHSHSAPPTSFKLSSTAPLKRDAHRPDTLFAIKLPPANSLTSCTQYTREGGRTRVGAKAAEVSGPSDVDSDDTTDLSGFIVSDSVSIYEEDEEEDKEEEAKPTEAIKAPRPARRLVRGRRPAITDDDSDEELNARMKQLSTAHCPPITPCESTENAGALRPDRTPPRSARPKSQLLASPTKMPPIPAPPYASHTDAFWEPDVINEWNEAYSPVKKKVREPVSRSIGDQPQLKTTDKTARAARRTFSATKQAIAEAFLAELDDKLTQGKVAQLAAPTGGIRITWSKNLTSTAGRAHWKRETLPNENTTTFRHHAKIELADKVIDDENRLLNVVAHEFCHLATFMVSGVRDRPHGREFQTWAAECARHFGERGVRVTTRHNYAIAYKYVWTCVACGREVQRHSKSVDPARQACGSCHGRLQQTKPPPRSTVSAYQLFVREHLPKLRRENPTSPQKEMMGLVAKRYHDAKTGRQQAEIARAGGVEDQVKVEDEIEIMARKLNMIDLTSPGK